MATLTRLYQLDARLGYTNVAHDWAILTWRTMAAAELIECRRRAGGLRESVPGDRQPSVASLGFCAEGELALGARFGPGELTRPMSEDELLKAGLGRRELGELGAFAGPSVRRPESSLARRPGRSSSTRWTSRTSDSDTFLSHTTGDEQPPCRSCVLVLGLWERSSGDSRRGASSFFIWSNAWPDAERARLVFALPAAPGGLIGPDPCSERAEEA